ncbi:citramalate synthase [Aliifodinibius salicampi]|uniref:Citramalate synthase n=1 Tax=Fodinibius salicampi TaxID=1920655 RepID=A0ABT3Q009_9BACT|nr:citramalate synthase [Fodinibius salicampi]MCW9713403.1 citramalate synthase [Fodinibius salicampi]
MDQQIQIFDTTLRDGTQGEKVAFSAEDKLRIAQRLDSLGIDYIEGGWPGSNPRDMEFFELAGQASFDHAKIVAFGSTCRAHTPPEKDRNLALLVDAGTPAVAIFGKSWLLHVEKALQISAEENLTIIKDSVRYLKEHDKEVIYDAEHFFDGYKANPDYTLSTLKAAEDAGADVLVLCDTNGGTLPHEVSEIVNEVGKQIDAPLGIHAHNDCELGVANALSAVQNGCVHVQGTINGYGERCGNTNLCSLIPNLQLKQNYHCIPTDNLDQLTAVSHFVSEVANLNPDIRQPYVGRSAFAHKGGIHVSAVMKNEETYEHIRPQQVGNSRRVLVSDLSGKSNINYKAEQLGIELEKYGDKVPEIVQKLKQLENKGYQFEAAEASFELLAKKMTGAWEEFFTLEGFRIIAEKNISGNSRTEATLRIKVNDQVEHCAAEGNGPVHALDKALRKALIKFYPEISEMHLTDYKVRVLNEKDGTGADVRVLIDSAKRSDSWGTVGVSHNIIDASWQALTDSFSYYLAKQAKNIHQKEAI